MLEMVDKYIGRSLKRFRVPNFVFRVQCFGVGLKNNTFEGFSLIILHQNFEI